MDRRLLCFADLEDDNPITRQFNLRDDFEMPKLLQPYPDFGFDNTLILKDEREKADLKNFWRVV
jgi:hypothetical protein